MAGYSRRIENSESHWAHYPPLSPVFRSYWLQHLSVTFLPAEPSFLPAFIGHGPLPAPPLLPARIPGIGWRPSAVWAGPVPGAGGGRG
uniref:SHANK associated RH domain interactor n=1 Tax=Rousettus aegyptiacus TaxID=9407 RepID=A0A7J8C459_ROUAE|nr:SHANK associated RH domain interactor [Rousettus aegyptiacus]